METNNVKKILDDITKIKERPLNKEGNLDLEAFNKLKEVKNQVLKLKKLGVDTKWLFENNFIMAGMVLRFNK